MTEDDFHDSITVTGLELESRYLYVLYKNKNKNSTNLLFKIRMIYNNNDHLNSLHPTSTHPTTANGHLDA